MDFPAREIILSMGVSTVSGRKKPFVPPHINLFVLDLLGKFYVQDLAKSTPSLFCHPFSMEHVNPLSFLGPWFFVRYLPKSFPLTFLGPVPLQVLRI